MDARGPSAPQLLCSRDRGVGVKLRSSGISVRGKFSEALSTVLEELVGTV